MAKITVFDFCRQIGAASDKIPVVVKAGAQVIGRFSSLYSIPSNASPGSQSQFRDAEMLRDYHPSQIKRLQQQAVTA